jgi:phosphonate metabolism protein PhnN/1,5-bisphosphokinase (PRPP-forming)
MNRLQAHSHHLLVIVGASGAGKDSVLKGWLASLPREQRPHRARRTITRGAGDASEDHEALDEAGFLAARAAGAFAFAWQAHGLHYGVRWLELEPLLQGRWVVMNGSRGHLPVLRTAAPQVHVIEVVAPDDLRRARLAQRGREAVPALNDRLARAAPDSGADLRITNDGDLSHAIAQFGRWWQRLAAPMPSP